MSALGDGVRCADCEAMLTDPARLLCPECEVARDTQ